MAAGAQRPRQSVVRPALEAGACGVDAVETIRAIGGGGGVRTVEERNQIAVVQHVVVRVVVRVRFAGGAAATDTDTGNAYVVSTLQSLQLSPGRGQLGAPPELLEVEELCVAGGAQRRRLFVVDVARETGAEDEEAGQLAAAGEEVERGR